MDTEPGELDPGILLGARQPYWGEKAELIKHLAVTEPGLNQRSIAGRVGCSEANVSDVLKRFLRRHSLDELRDFQANQGDVLDALWFESLSSITPDKVAKASYSQLVMGAAILQDKSRLVRGQPTSIHVHALIDVLDALAAHQDRDDD